MRTIKGIEDTITGIIICDGVNHNIARKLAKEIIEFLKTEDNLAVPPIDKSKNEGSI